MVSEEWGAGRGGCRAQRFEGAGERRIGKVGAKEKARGRKRVNETGARGVVNEKAGGIGSGTGDVYLTATSGESGAERKRERLMKHNAVTES